MSTMSLTKTTVVVETLLIRTTLIPVSDLPTPVLRAVLHDLIPFDRI